MHNVATPRGCDIEASNRLPVFLPRSCPAAATKWGKWNMDAEGRRG